MRAHANAVLAIGLAGALWLPGGHSAPSSCSGAVKAMQQPWESMAVFADRHEFPFNGTTPNVTLIVVTTMRCEGTLTSRQAAVIDRGDWNARLGGTDWRGTRPLTWWVTPAA